MRCKVMITIHEKSPNVPPTTTFWSSFNQSIHCQRKGIVYSFLKDILLIAAHAVHTYCIWPCQRQGHCLFFMYSGVLPCGSTAARYINSQTGTHSFKDGKGNLKDVAVCVCPLQAVPSVSCPSSFNSLALNGLCRALQPNHRPASFRLTEYNKDSGGKWHLWTCCLTTAKMSSWTGLLVAGFLLFASFTRCACEGEWQKSGSQCVCFPVSCLPVFSVPDVQSTQQSIRCTQII